MSNWFRRRRFARFEAILSEHEAPIRILDVGGRESFWRNVGLVGSAEVSIDIINLGVEPKQVENLRLMPGDACDLSDVEDGCYDIAFSNSVIEHVGDHEKQKAMAAEILRVAGTVFLQTPNRAFPVEPHFMFPMFQFLPRRLQTRLLMTFPLGNYKRQPDEEAAARAIDSIRLLSKRELIELFPEADLEVERVLGLPKSYTVVQKRR